MTEYIKKYYVYIIGIGIFALVLLFSFSSDDENSFIFEPVKQTESMEEVKYIYIDIKGEVMNQGVYKVEEGTRLFQVITLAGGLTVDADVLAFNLSINLRDEQVVYIPSYSDMYPLITEVIDDNEGGIINVNTASSVLLETLPGIGPTTAQSIIDYREEFGNFSHIDDLLMVPGIGEITLNEIKDFIKI